MNGRCWSSERNARDRKITRQNAPETATHVPKSAGKRPPKKSETRRGPWPVNQGQNAPRPAKPGSKAWGRDPKANVAPRQRKCRPTAGGIRRGGLLRGRITFRPSSRRFRISDWRCRSWSCRPTGRRSGIRRSRPFSRSRKDCGFPSFECASCSIPSSKKLICFHYTIESPFCQSVFAIFSRPGQDFFHFPPERLLFAAFGCIMKAREA